MSEMILNEKQIMDFELLEPVRGGSQYDSNLVIYFVLNGKLNVGMGEDALALGENDFLIINPFRPHTLDMKESPLVMKFAVNLNVVSDYYDVSKMVFRGNSVQEESVRHGELRNLLKKCVVYYYGKGSREGRILLKLNSLYYEIAELLISSFSVVESDQMKNKGGFDELLIQEMTRYIQLNYQYPLKLEELAERFYLSPAYISRYFKKKLGINFAKYLTGIRLNEAVKELENTSKPLTRIAMDCGFPNLASFNRAFKERYGTNPKDYRGALEEPQETRDPASYQTVNPAEMQLLDYFEKNDSFMEQEYDETGQIEADTGSYTVLTKTWNRLINIGSLSMLLQKVIQDHTVFLCKTLGFEYVRVWDIYDNALHINAGSREEKYNFSRLDVCFDFLMEHHIKPYLELGFKPFILLKNYEKYTVNVEREIPFDTPEQYGSFLRHLMRHLINRYSKPEVATWYFEVWCDPRWFPDGDAAPFIDYFEQAYQAIKELSPGSRVGGDYDRPYGIIDFEEFIRRWSVRSIQPDFVSLYCYYPIIKDQMEEEDLTIEDMRSFRLTDYVENKKNILMKYGMMMPVFSSEWNFTVINANALNDSRFKGAYIMKFLMELYEEMELWGYWFGTDFFVEDDDVPKLLNGRCGLITHQGICKPAYWAMKFMNRLEPYLLKKTSNMMVTMDEMDSYVIACHNYKELAVPYYIQQERDVTIENIPLLYENNKRLVLTVRVSGVSNGLYHIKTRMVNSQYGCVQDEWVRMDKVAYLTMSDVAYIDHISRPRITIAEQMVTDHVLRFTVELEPQEIRLIHAFQYVEEE